jgi:inhibitor of KinA sporulation pathway (predicted exonuclease)
MKKETRVYLVNIDNVIVKENLLAKNISEFIDNEFIDLAEQYGDVMTLPKLQDLINNDNIVMSDYYIRFIEVELHELTQLDNDLYERAE